MKIQLGSFSIPRGLTFVPYSSGVLESYIKNCEDAPECEFILPLYDYDQTPDTSIDILGITCYVWSQDHIDAMCAEYKKNNPHVTIIYGGPNIPVDSTLWEKYQSERPFVDVFVAGTGEEIFLQLLKEFPNFTKKWYKLEKDGKYRYDTPIPYTDGTLDHFINNDEETFGAI